MSQRLLLQQRVAQILENYRLRDVFTPGGMPSVTYVNRENLGLERKLREALDRGHSIITVSGPTKSGKTVLCRTVIPIDTSVWVEGGRIKSEEDFWNFLADMLEVASNTTAEKISSNGTINEFTASASVGIQGILGGKGGGTTSSKTTRAVGISKDYQSDIKRRCIRTAIDRKLTIVIDDFHFLERTVQKSIVKSLLQNRGLGHRETVPARRLWVDGPKAA